MAPRLSLEEKRKRVKDQLVKAKKELAKLKREEKKAEKEEKERLETRKALIIWRKIQKNAAESKQGKTYLDRLLETLEDREERLLFGLYVPEEQVEEKAPESEQSLFTP